jgi:hypothetical protein
MYGRLDDGCGGGPHDGVDEDIQRVSVATLAAQLDKPSGLGFRAEGLGFSLGFRVKGLGFRV